MGAKALRNAANIHKLLVDWEGSCVLYRMCVSGPSGQRWDKPIARVRYAYDDTGHELAVIDLTSGEVVGYLYRSTDFKHMGMWTVQSHCDDIPDYEFNRLLGWSSCAVLGADVLVNGAYAATANHDHARVSRGKWVAYVPKD
jgi:hypothetical protein